MLKLFSKMHPEIEQEKKNECRTFGVIKSAINLFKLFFRYLDIYIYIYIYIYTIIIFL